MCQALGWLRGMLLGLLVLGGLATWAANVSAAEDGADEPSEPTGPVDDEACYARLFDEYLFDPTDAQWVQATVQVRSVWAHAGETQRYGWLKGEGEEARIYFIDGASVPVTEETPFEPVDFLEFCQARIDALEEEQKPEDDRDEVFDRMDRVAVGVFGIDDLYLAAWLHRLGHEGPAKKLYTNLYNRTGDKFAEHLQGLKGQLGWTAFAGMVHAYMVRADEEALEHGERLLELYSEAVEEHPQAEQIVAELYRRQENGTFGNEPSEEWPEGFTEWPVEERVDYLIGELDEVDARQWGQPGGVSLAGDRRVAALIEIGDPAVPRLIEVIENDDRLTRSVHFWRDFAASRTVLSVREAAVTAVMSILQVRVFQPVSTGDNLTARGEEASAELAAKLRDYWEEWGKLPFDERMMAILTDDETTLAAKREAAQNLGRLGQRVGYSTTVFSDTRAGDVEEGPNPAVAKFSDPTAAEAIFATMMQDLPDDRVQRVYIAALAGLGDDRIRPLLAEQSEVTESRRMRRRLAFLCAYLGDREPWKNLAAEFEAGTLLGAVSVNEIRNTIGDLARDGSEESEQALWALTSVQHPYNGVAAEYLLTENFDTFNESAQWFMHPYCVEILGQLLHDETPTGQTYRIEDDTLKLERANGWSSGRGVPPFLKEEHLSEAEERRCDQAAIKLCTLVWGLPEYHPLLVDKQERLERMTQLLEGYGRRLRRLSEWERRSLGFHWREFPYCPEIGLLDHPATAEDYTQGRAVFHLEGRGELTDLQLPAVAVVPSDSAAENAEPERGLIVQAERDSASGVVTYGILFRDGPQVLAAEEVEEVLPIGPEQQAEEQGSEGEELEEAAADSNAATE